LMAQRKHGNDGNHFDRSVLPVTEQSLLSFRDYPPTCRVPLIRQYGIPNARPVSAHPGPVDKTGDCRTADAAAAAAAKRGAVRIAGPTTGRGPCPG
jgi:hypothetical protein